MTKEEFFQFLDKAFKNTRVTVINETLKNLPFYSWRDEYLRKRNSGYVRCKNCKQYVKASDCRTEKETYSVLIGTREHTRYYCPLCNKVAYEDF